MGQIGLCKAAVVVGVPGLGQGHVIAWGERYGTGQTRGGTRGPAWAGNGNVTRYVTEAGGGRAAVRDWSKHRGGRAQDGAVTSPPGPDRSPGVNTYIPRSLQGKGWSGNDEQRAGRALGLHTARSEVDFLQCA